MELRAPSGNFPVNVLPLIVARKRKAIPAKPPKAPSGDVDELEISPNEPKFVRNQTELAKLLGLSRRTVQNYAKLTGSPATRADGRIKVADWRRFLAQHDAEVDPRALNGRKCAGVESLSLRETKILAEIKLLQQKHDERAKILVNAADVERDVAAMIMQAKTVLLSGPSSLAPQVVGVSVQEAETLLREWLHSALSRLHTEALA